MARTTKIRRTSLSSILKVDAELNRIDTKFQWARWRNRQDGLESALDTAARYIVTQGFKRAAEYLALRASLMGEKSRVYFARTERHVPSEDLAHMATQGWMPGITEVHVGSLCVTEEAQATYTEYQAILAQ